jgi:hypothetical protein
MARHSSGFFLRDGCRRVDFFGLSGMMFDLARGTVSPSRLRFRGFYERLELPSARTPATADALGSGGAQRTRGKLIVCLARVDAEHFADGCRAPNYINVCFGFFFHLVPFVASLCRTLTVNHAGRQVKTCFGF